MPPIATPEEAARHAAWRVRYAAQRDEDRQQIFAGWKALRKGKPPRTPRELREICLFHVKNPELIGGPFAPAIYDVMEDYLARHPQRPPNPREVAALVDHCVAEHGMRFEEARHAVAKALGKTFDSVKQCHLRFGGAKRDKTE